MEIFDRYKCCSCGHIAFSGWNCLNCGSHNLMTNYQLLLSDVKAQLARYRMTITFKPSIEAHKECSLSFFLQHCEDQLRREPTWLGKVFWQTVLEYVIEE